ncbi:hypothetical protein GOL26_22660 [Sinorhizobium medicae]|nr:hypothetical protein [Sinorhizobium medicae]MDX0997697.1 hypothetical protein [Sinorhizobium medicae]MDX1181526.1 hypothetical protein [Sinorhizobium medicae]
MARVMRDATVAATAKKLFEACGTSWLEDSYMHWSAAVRAWSVGSTRPLHDEDRQAIVYAIQELDEAEIERVRAIEAAEDAEAEAAALEIIEGVRWVKHNWDRERDRLVSEYAIGRQSSPGWYREGSIDEIEARENAGQRELFS